MTYKGYTGKVQGVDEVNGVVYGWLADTRDVIAFQGTTTAELVADFRGAIDDYLQWCAEDGLTPNPPQPATTPDSGTQKAAKAVPAVARSKARPRSVSAKSSKPSA